MTTQKCKKCGTELTANEKGWSNKLCTECDIIQDKVEDGFAFFQSILGRINENKNYVQHVDVMNEDIYKACEQYFDKHPNDEIILEGDDE
jgi:hypothetical protein